jgi:hypothetical protein
MSVAVDSCKLYRVLFPFLVITRALVRLKALVTSRFLRLIYRQILLPSLCLAVIFISARLSISIQNHLLSLLFQIIVTGQMFFKLHFYYIILYLHYVCAWSRVSSGGIVSDYGLGDRGSIPGRGKEFFL